MELQQAASSSSSPPPSHSFTPDGQYRIDGSDLGLLGAGAHGTVRIAQHVETLTYVAVKISPISVMRSACKEMTALTRLHSQNIVQLLGVQVDMQEERVFIVMELCQGGELFDRIAECGGLVEEEARRYFVQILLALRHCHRNRVFHRDLKPENILLDTDDNAKVADFGLAAVYKHVVEDASFLQHTKVGSIMYAAPEVLASTEHSGYDAAAADMWSLGVILFSMLSGTLPFQCAAASRCKRYAMVLRQGIQVMCPEHLPRAVTSLLARMLHPDPAQRFTPQQALDSEWIAGTSGGPPTSPSSRPEADDEARARDAARAHAWAILLRLPLARGSPPRGMPPGAAGARPEGAAGCDLPGAVGGASSREAPAPEGAAAPAALKRKRADAGAVPATAMEAECAAARATSGVLLPAAPPAATGAGPTEAAGGVALTGNLAYLSEYVQRWGLRVLPER